MENENNTMNAEIVEDYILGDQDFEENVQKVPVIILCDVSSSMHGAAIRALAEGAKNFIEEVKKSPEAHKSVDLSFICYNHAIVSESNFCSVDEFKMPNFNASGGTNTSNALYLALDKVKARKAHHRSKGNGIKQPWIVLISDGYGGNITQVAEEIRLMKENRKLTFFSLGIGKNAPLGDMAKFGPVIGLAESTHIGKFFEWLSGSLESVSSGAVGENVNLKKPDSLYMQITA